jgi:hypothetical protein
MSRFIAHHIARIRAATECGPIDWGAVRGSAIALARQVTRVEQRAALEMLKGADERESLRRATDEVERAFGKTAS